MKSPCVLACRMRLLPGLLLLVSLLCTAITYVHSSPICTISGFPLSSFVADYDFLTYQSAVSAGTYVDLPVPSLWTFQNSAGLYKPTTATDSAAFVTSAKSILGCASSGQIFQMLKTNLTVGGGVGHFYQVQATIYNSKAWGPANWSFSLAYGPNSSSLKVLASTSQLQNPVADGAFTNIMVKDSVSPTFVAVPLPLWIQFSAKAASTADKICISNVVFSTAACVASTSSSSSSTTTTTEAPTKSTTTRTRTTTTTTTVNHCDPNPCSNMGVCVNSQFSYTCTCQAGFSGATCDTYTNLCSTNPCLHGATCFDKGPSNPLSVYSCTCTAQWRGFNCQDFNPCAVHAVDCLNGATCVNKAFGSSPSVMCTCRPFFEGYYCDIPFIQVDFFNESIWNGKLVRHLLPGDVTGSLTGIRLNITKFVRIIGRDVYANDLSVYIHGANANDDFQVGGFSSLVQLSANPQMWGTCGKSSPCNDFYNMTLGTTYHNPILFSGSPADPTISFGNGYVENPTYVAAWTGSIKLYGLYNNYITITTTNRKFMYGEVLTKVCAGSLTGSLSAIAVSISTPVVFDIDNTPARASDLSLVVNNLAHDTSGSNILYYGGEQNYLVAPYFNRKYYGDVANGCCANIVQETFMLPTPINFDTNNFSVSLALAYSASATYNATFKLYGVRYVDSGLLPNYLVGKNEVSVGCTGMVNQICYTGQSASFRNYGHICDLKTGFTYSEISVQDGATSFTYLDQPSPSLNRDIIVTHSFVGTVSKYTRNNNKGYDFSGPVQQKFSMDQPVKTLYWDASDTSMVGIELAMFIVYYEGNRIDMTIDGQVVTVWRGIHPRDALFLDVDKDDYFDLVVASEMGITYSRWQGPYNYSSSPVVLSTGSSAWSVAATDINSDSSPDLVFVQLGINKVYWLRSFFDAPTQMGAFAPVAVLHTNIMSPQGVDAIENGVIVSFKDTVVSFIHNSSTEFTSQTLYTAVGARCDVSVGGLIDENGGQVSMGMVVVTDSTHSTVIRFMFSADLASRTSMSAMGMPNVPGTANPNAVLVVDVDEDGDYDAIVSYLSPASIVLFQNGLNGLCYGSSCMSPASLPLPVQDMLPTYDKYGPTYGAMGDVLLLQPTDLTLSVRGQFHVSETSFDVAVLLSATSLDFSSNIANVTVTVGSVSITKPFSLDMASFSNPASGVMLHIKHAISGSVPSLLTRNLGVNVGTIKIAFKNSWASISGALLSTF